MARLTFVFETPLAYDATFPGYIAPELARIIASKTTNGSLPVDIVEASIQCDHHDRSVHEALRALGYETSGEDERFPDPPEDEDDDAEADED